MPEPARGDFRMALPAQTPPSHNPAEAHDCLSAGITAEPMRPTELVEAVWRVLGQGGGVR